MRATYGAGNCVGLEKIFSQYWLDEAIDQPGNVDNEEWRKKALKAVGADANSLVVEVRQELWQSIQVHIH